jgi:hypothetical protein
MMMMMMVMILTTMVMMMMMFRWQLLNLLLVGRAVSNVFDGDRGLGESGLTLHGIPFRPNVGYLTHLEALRYVQVRGFGEKKYTHL